MDSWGGLQNEPTDLQDPCFRKIDDSKSSAQVTLMASILFGLLPSSIAPPPTSLEAGIDRMVGRHIPE